MPGMCKKPLACAGCELFGDGWGFSALEGDGRSRLAVYAEALGENEEEQGLPLRPDGASGKVFRRALWELGIDETSLTISNVIRCRPPGNELWGQPYYYPAVDHCAQYMRRDIATRQPRVLLGLGDIPYHNLRDPREPVAGQLTAIRGFVLPGKYNLPLIATYHPAYIARGAWHLFGAFKHDIGTAARMAREGVPVLETQYELHPSVERCWGYYRYLVANPTLPINYDVETREILGQADNLDWRRKTIVQIQFSPRAGYAIVFPYEGDYRRVAHAILALPNPKGGWNSRLSDDLALQGDGAILKGELHDWMNAWGHLQPSYWGGKDDQDTDKGVPSRLMGLQSCTSFYCPEFGPWKHLGTPGHIAADPEAIYLYGAKDADATARCGAGIMASLEAQGLMAGYRDHKLGVRPVLDYLGEVGIPVDRGKQADLRVFVAGELQSLQTRIQAIVPSEILGKHPKAGYKALHSKVSVATEGLDKDSWPKTPVRGLIEGYDPENPPLVMAAGHVGYLKQGVFYDGTTVNAEEKSATANYFTRWYIERLYNPHGSSPNTKAYIRYCGYPMPKKIGTSDDTTGKAELAKLAKSTKDPVLAMTNQWREMAKVGGDYTGPKWVPGEDGRVHATFKFGTTSDQLVATDPPVMTYPEHSDIAKKAKGCIVAQPGHILVKVDKRGFHSRWIGWLAKDRAYYELADSDVHSFITAHFLRLPGCEDIFDLEDGERRAVLERIKEEHKFTRNYQVKRTTHGRQFVMGVNKLYEMHAPNFDPSPEKMIVEVGEAKWYDWNAERQRKEISRRGFRVARRLFNLFDTLFPMTFVVFPEWVREQIVDVTRCRLVSPAGSHRYFYDYDIQQATSYLPSNLAHRDFQASAVQLYHSGDLARFEAINSTHDALWFHPLEELAGDCIATVQAEFNTARIVPGWENNPLGPFQCNSDAEVGYSLAAMDPCTPENVYQILAKLKEKQANASDSQLIV